MLQNCPCINRIQSIPWWWLSTLPCELLALEKA